MTTWQPMTSEEIQALIEDELPKCTPEQQAVFDAHRIPLRQTPITRCGRLEKAYVAAERDGEVMYYEDVEEGWNFSPLTTDGHIAEHWCSQDELKYALWRWTAKSGKTTAGWR